MSNPQGSKQGDFLLIGGAVLVLVIFFGGYRLGMSGEQKNSGETLSSSKSEEISTRKMIAKCFDKGTTYQSKDANIQKRLDSLKQELLKAQETHDNQYDNNARKSDDVTNCLGDLDVQRKSWENEDIMYKEKIEGLTLVQKMLNDQIASISSARSQPRNYLNLALEKMRWENMRLRIKLGKLNTEDVEKMDLNAWESSLVEKYAAAIGNGSSTMDSLRPISDSENVTYSGKRKTDYLFEFNKTAHPNVFLYQFTEDGKLKRPVYFGRDGFNQVQQGVLYEPMAKKYMRMATIPRVFKNLYDYALCAYRNNNPNITYPDVFILKPPQLVNVSNTTQAKQIIQTVSPNRTHASELFDTPLITFCKDCRQMANTSEFKLACLGDTVSAQYASYDFWAMRSMLRWNPGAYLAANDYIEEKGWSGEPYAAVVYRTDIKTLRDCGKYRKPQRHFMYLSKNANPNEPIYLWKGDGVGIINASSPPRAKRAEPACAVPYSGLIENLKAMKETTGLKRFYIHTKWTALKGLKRKLQKAWENLKFEAGDSYAKTDDGSLEIILETPRRSEPEKQLVDLTVLERSKVLLVDAFSEHSQVVSENWLLRNEFNQKNIYVF